MTHCKATTAYLEPAKLLINPMKGRGNDMKSVKQLKQTVLKIEKKNRVRKMSNHAFATLRTNFGFTYQD